MLNWAKFLDFIAFSSSFCLNGFVIKCSLERFVFPVHEKQVDFRRPTDGIRLSIFALHIGMANTVLTLFSNSQMLFGSFLKLSVFWLNSHQNNAVQFTAYYIERRRKNLYWIIVAPDFIKMAKWRYARLRGVRILTHWCYARLRGVQILTHYGVMPADMEFEY